MDVIGLRVRTFIDHHEANGGTPVGQRGQTEPAIFRFVYDEGGT
jgi:hypothetical protein